MWHLNVLAQILAHFFFTKILCSEPPCSFNMSSLDLGHFRLVFYTLLYKQTPLTACQLADMGTRVLCHQSSNHILSMWLSPFTYLTTVPRMEVGCHNYSTMRDNSANAERFYLKITEQSQHFLSKLLKVSSQLLLQHFAGNCHSLTANNKAVFLDIKPHSTVGNRNNHRLSLDGQH